MRRCRLCKYDLTGHAEVCPICPECGRQWFPRKPYPAWLTLRALGLATGPVMVAAVPFVFASGGSAFGFFFVLQLIAALGCPPASVIEACVALDKGRPEMPTPVILGVLFTSWIVNAFLMLATFLAAAAYGLHRDGYF
jgi:hypothetical protein